jgi:Tol biopolymer transport system component
LESPTATRLNGTEGGSWPFWSPDGRYLAFSANGKLKKIGLSGEPAETLAETQATHGTWSRDGVILFQGVASDRRIFRIPAAGGTPMPVTVVRGSPDFPFGGFHGYTCFLPDGRHFIYLVFSFRRPEGNGIYLGSLDTTSIAAPKLILKTQWMATFAPPNYLLFVRGGKLLAQRLDLGSFHLTGEPIVISDGLAIDPADSASISASLNGVLTHSNAWLAPSQLIWFDRQGRLLNSIESGGVGSYAIRLSPDGNRVALTTADPQSGLDIWVRDFSRNTMSRLTFDGRSNARPVWSPDGTRIIFESAIGELGEIYEKPASGMGETRLLMVKGQLPPTNLQKAPSDWSSDGKYILFTKWDNKTKLDLWAVPTAGDRKPAIFLQTPFDEAEGQFSPNVRWVAYSSFETGRAEVYVQPFPTAAGRWQISTAGGRTPRWRRNGKEAVLPVGRQ